MAQFLWRVLPSIDYPSLAHKFAPAPPRSRYDTIMTLNPGSDPMRHSWIDSANEATTDFPLQNLPYGVFRTTSVNAARIGVAIGDRILDLHAAAKAGLLSESVGPACQRSTLNALMSLGAPAWAALRVRLSELLGADSCPKGAPRDRVEACLVRMSDATMLLPASIGDYTDFYASSFHATNVGSMLRPGQPLLPNYKWVPIGYHGRSSSIIVSDTPVRRPRGQARIAVDGPPVFAASQSLDYELELGVFIGPGNTLGEPVPLAQATDHLFGVVLLNDWSARDIQSWEYQPLGPFLAKNFSTTISPWVVTMEALAPFRWPVVSRPPADPAPLPYLSDPGNSALGGLGLTLEAWIRTPRMLATGAPPHRLSSGNFRDMYWTLAQLLAHHTSNGCNLRPGDLLGSGTVSGETRDSRGCLLELTWRGAEPVSLPNGEERRFLHDGDEIILRGYAERTGFRRIGLGECRGRVLPAGT